MTLLRAKTLHIIIFILGVIFCVFGIIKYPNADTAIVFAISLFIAQIGLIFSATQNSIGSVLLTIYYILVVPLQFLMALYNPEAIISANYNKYYDAWLFYDNGIIWKYLFYSTLFYFIGLMSCFIVEHVYVKQRILTIDLEPRNILIRHPLVLLIIFEIIDFSLRQSDINGYISYALYGILLFLLANVLVNAFNPNLPGNQIIQVVMGILIYSLSGILQGRREYIISSTVAVIIYLVLAQKEYVFNFLTKRKFALVVIIVLFLGGFSLANYYKFGVFNPIGLFVSRIVGLFDGASVLKYLETTSVELGFGNYIEAALTDSAMRANRYYTYVIIGYPSTASTGSAAPIFISSLLYGFKGMIFFSSVFTLIFAIIANNARKYSYLVADVNCEEDYEVISRLKFFVICYTLFFMIYSYFMDGNIEILKGFSTPVMAYFLIYLFGLISREK